MVQLGEDLRSEPGYALSLSQPWAWAVVHGPKRIENRRWTPGAAATMVGRRFCIHAAQSWDGEAQELLRRRGLPVPMQVELARGAILGVATLVRTFMVDDVDPATIAADQLQWAGGPLCLELADVVALPRPVPARGLLGFWWLPPHTHEAVQHQLAELRHA